MYLQLILSRNVIYNFVKINAIRTILLLALAILLNLRQQMRVLIEIRILRLPLILYLLHQVGNQMIPFILISDHFRNQLFIFFFIYFLLLPPFFLSFFLPPSLEVLFLLVLSLLLIFAQVFVELKFL